MEDLTQLSALRSMDRVYLYFALGKAYEDLETTAFEKYLSGNQIKRSESRYIAEHMVRFTEQTCL